MNKKFSNGLAVILPNKRINLFVFFIIVLGIISGSIFLLALNEIDMELVTNQIGTFITNISDNNISNINAFRNSIIGNSIFILLIWILGMSIVGIIVNIFLLYFKGFILGFTLSSFFYIYGYKGLVLGFAYLLPGGIINIIAILIIGVYSVILTSNLWKVIFFRDKGYSLGKFLKKYLFILLISFGLIIASSLSESYLFPAIIKLFIKLFI